MPKTHKSHTRSRRGHNKGRSNTLMSASLGITRKRADFYGVKTITYASTNSGTAVVSVNNLLLSQAYAQSAVVANNLFQAVRIKRVRLISTGPCSIDFNWMGSPIAPSAVPVGSYVPYAPSVNLKVETRSSVTPTILNARPPRGSWQSEWQGNNPSTSYPLFTFVSDSVVIQMDITFEYIIRNSKNLTAGYTGSFAYTPLATALTTGEVYCRCADDAGLFRPQDFIFFY